MSDGSISQDEIDALLSGVDMGGFGGASEAKSSKLSDFQKSTLENFLSENVASFAANLESMTGKSAAVENPVIEILNRDAFLRNVPEMAVATLIDFDKGLSGEHVFLMAPEFAQKLVSLVTHEENTKIDDMALSIVSETISQYVGTELTSLAAKGVKDVSTIPAESVNVPKAMVRLPQHDMGVFTYKIKIDDTQYTLWEVMPEKLIHELVEKIGGTDPSTQAGVQPDMQMGGFQPGGMNMQTGNPQMPGMNMQMGIPQQMNGMQQGGMIMPGINPNVQSVQFQPLQNVPVGTEQGNIGLIMDVYMEVTVELGRTRMIIKDILGMGEGHIIELDKLAGEPVDILVNHKPIAKGEVVVIDENFGVRVTEILSPVERIADI
ncbi:flagellar motor switch protein FliN [Treponema phagedenis]|uniref:Flagellar motor switch protein FliN n=1 Tax=Treponema phagedenis TaxID=162 RepID=A0A0B7H0B5_TREPH|nr:flagellar motor switch protein FliN [Treponema phagedenis]EFW36738.1 flagellar motor switch protein FliN [Treponema phagedenis F0421]NVP24121.1 flagellar motor switch protein FliN [Treponema phagedenis]QEJ96261.1 flagellar motor switch protein FliN [Treponema phagedenis]QEJ99316.1 flagellar motor switch protein FliN [Treponema phagedenis]QEK00039.1 flagellar motor switch protein FliN [Treponema phagedenis]